MGYWLGSGVMWVYLATTNGLALVYPDSDLPNSSSNWIMRLVTGGAILTTLLSTAATRATIRYAVLTADGHHVRLYPYGSFFGLGVGKAVTVPVKHLSIRESVNRKGKETETLMVHIRDSAVPVQFDKPADLLQLGRVFGTGVRFSAAGGVTGVAEGPAPAPSGDAKAAADAAGAATDAAGAAAAGLGGAGGAPVAGNTAAAAASTSYLPPSALYELPVEVRERLRSYALLLHVLHGRPVADMARLASGAWELERMGEQLGSHAHLLQLQLQQGRGGPGTGTGADSPSSGEESAGSGSGGSSSKAARIAELVHWRKARDPASGRVYWWNTASFATQWHTPAVDGMGPYEWHPHLAARDEPLPAGTAPAALK